MYHTLGFITLGILQALLRESSHLIVAPLSELGFIEAHTLDLHRVDIQVLLGGIEFKPYGVRFMKQKDTENNELFPKAIYEDRLREYFLCLL